MKNKRLFWCLMGTLAVLSCGKEAPVDVPETEVAVYDPWTMIAQEALPATGGPESLTAGFATKSHLELNEAGTSASVIWSPNDAFTLYNILPNGGYYSAVYTTTAGGAAANFTKSDGGIGSTYYQLHAVYPAPYACGSTTISGVSHSIFGTTIPISQAATPGSVAEGANIAYAAPQGLSSPLSFKNLVSVIKFRMSGEIVSSVRSISFRGMSDIAGDFVFYAPDGLPQIVTTIYFPGHTERSSTVTLTGSFDADTDYYIAIAPCSQNRFSMVFANEDGSETTTLTSKQSMNFERSAITDFGTIDLGSAFTDDFSSLAPIRYKTATAADMVKPVSIVVIPDGYTEEEMADFEDHATAALDALFNTEPYKSYESYFNAWILKAISEESGANITDGSGNITTAVNCYFGSRWGASSYGDMVADANIVYSFVQQNCPDIMDGSHSIDEVPILMLINDSRYGGKAHSTSSGRTYCQVPITKTNGSYSLSWAFPNVHAVSATATASNSNYVSTTQAERDEMGYSTGTWCNTVAHEFGGHSFGRLGDEYWGLSYYTGYASIPSQSWTPLPFAMNLSAYYATTPWDTLLENRDALVANNSKYARIGVFQGGGESIFNRWRSEMISCMIDNRFYFSTWQRWLIVDRIRTLAGLAPSTLQEFLAKDNPSDPIRDGASAPVSGISNAVPPRTMPMLPPPDFSD